MAKIFIDAQCLVQKRTGVGWAAKYLLENLSLADKYNQYTLFYFGGKNVITDLSDLKLGSNFKIKKYTLISRRVIDNLFKIGLLPKVRFFLGKYDLYFNLSTINFDMSGEKNIITLYDIAYIDRPADTEDRHLTYLNKFGTTAIRNANSIITSSNFSRNRIIDHFKLNPSKVTIIPLAVDTDVYTPIHDESISTKISQKYDLKKFFLFISTIEPRKNVSGILDAYKLLSENIKNEYELILIGSRGWNDQGIWEKIDSMQSEGENIRHLGYVSQAELPYLYSLATSFVYPSWYEGFGLPILEAQACSTCVITSDSGCCAEIVKDSAILVNNSSTESIAKGMMLSIDDKINKKYQRLGLENIKRYSWEKSGRKLFNLIEEVVLK